MAGCVRGRWTQFLGEMEIGRTDRRRLGTIGMEWEAGAWQECRDTAHFSAWRVREGLPEAVIATLGPDRGEVS